MNSFKLKVKEQIINHFKEFPNVQKFSSFHDHLFLWSRSNHLFCLRSLTILDMYENSGLQQFLHLTNKLLTIEIIGDP